ncbi:hypothetical protein M422DRAFT_30867 [Sphaerobolus stellatus SS14]|uniref:Uncharacterized protein n=1 Tax=Sphaerobolus stellatus (strain SS14) TaxID=990650 RepID=A0A0C9VN70_SPHS4|nr:hypothetical protein M422DRAFT_30867 [Sphaerobolus stellatus SS14]
MLIGPAGPDFTHALSTLYILSSFSILLESTYLEIDMYTLMVCHHRALSTNPSTLDGSRKLSHT